MQCVVMPTFIRTDGRKPFLSLYQTALRMGCWGQRSETKMQLDSHKSFSCQDTLHSVMFSLLACFLLMLFTYRMITSLQTNGCTGSAMLHSLGKKHTMCLKAKLISLLLASAMSLWLSLRMVISCSPHFDGKVILFSSLYKEPKSQPW